MLHCIEVVSALFRFSRPWQPEKAWVKMDGDLVETEKRGEVWTKKWGTGRMSKAKSKIMANSFAMPKASSKVYESKEYIYLYIYIYCTISYIYICVCVHMHIIIYIYMYVCVCVFCWIKWWAGLASSLMFVLSISHQWNRSACGTSMSSWPSICEHIGLEDPESGVRTIQLTYRSMLASLSSQRRFARSYDDSLVDCQARSCMLGPVLLCPVQFCLCMFAYRSSRR